MLGQYSSQFLHSSCFLIPRGNYLEGKLLVLLVSLLSNIWYKSLKASLILVRVGKLSGGEPQLEKSASTELGIK